MFIPTILNPTYISTYIHKEYISHFTLGHKRKEVFPRNCAGLRNKDLENYLKLWFGPCKKKFFLCGHLKPT